MEHDRHQPRRRARPWPGAPTRPARRCAFDPPPGHRRRACPVRRQLAADHDRAGLGQRPGAGQALVDDHGLLESDVDYDCELWREHDVDDDVNDDSKQQLLLVHDSKQQLLLVLGRQLERRRREQRDDEPVMSETIELPIEQRDTFRCFGSQCTVIVADARAAEAANAVAAGRRRLLEWHGQFSRFEPRSELARLNDDPDETVKVSPLMRRVVEAGIRAAQATGGLVDPTLLGQIERAGYDAHLEGPGLPVGHALALAPAREPGGPSVGAWWRLVQTDRRTSTVTRPPGVRFDPGGIAKGVFADELAALLAGYEAFVVDCGGDLRLGGRLGLAREVHVASPFDDAVLHTFTLRTGGVATSGIGKRSWIGPDGSVAHHLLDPATGRPAFTGIVQATALAPTAVEAEALSKAALLSGPADAERVLVHGGLIVLEDGNFVALDRGIAAPGPANLGQSASLEHPAAPNEAE
jgi:FAD:protein FMN transferase